MTKLEVTIKDWDNHEIRDGESESQLIHIEADEEFVAIRPEGYGEASAADGSGFPILIEKRDGELRLIVWADINQQDPTQIITLESARESVRKETTNE
jgi:hypothetical protein